MVKDPKDMSKLALAINGQVIGEWFKEQFGRLFSSVKRTVEPLVETSFYLCPNPTQTCLCDA